jgi:hypothetical protein
VSISVLKLHSLGIFENNMQEGDFGSSSDFCQVMIVEDRLKEFYYNSHLIDEYCLYNSFSLEKAVIATNWEDDVIEQIALRVINLLVGISNVEQLTLAGHTIWVCLPSLFVNSKFTLNIDILVEKLNPPLHCLPKCGVI